jgi:cobalt-zinc-cadmium efflux system protein
MIHREKNSTTPPSPQQASTHDDKVEGPSYDGIEADRHHHADNNAHREKHAHGHDHTRGASARALAIALALTTGFLIVELVGGVVAQSLALISDAAHMFTDAAALAIALLAIRMAKKPADRQRTFGYHRFEVLAAAFNALLLLVVAGYILYEAWRRLLQPPDIHSTLMIGVAVIGLVVNLISMRVLAGGQDHNLNMRGAYLEVWADMIGSIGVIAGALIIRFTGWEWVDPLVAVAIGLWVVPRTWTLLKSSVNVLLEGVPEDVDATEVREALLELPGVTSLHDLHLWSVTSGKNTVTVHLVCAAGVDPVSQVLPAARALLAQRFDIGHSTVQCETTPCEHASPRHACFDETATQPENRMHAH